MTSRDVTTGPGSALGGEFETVEAVEVFQVASSLVLDSQVPVCLSERLLSAFHIITLTELAETWPRPRSLLLNGQRGQRAPRSQI
jgi:hypothetical protein